jgi:glucose-6-phosphate isomerase
MFYSHFDVTTVTPESQSRGTKKLKNYREQVQKIVNNNNNKKPEYSLAHVKQPSLHDNIEAVKKEYKGIKHLILVGIGGSNLGTEAVHEALGDSGVQLHSLDTIAAYQIEKVLADLKTVKSAKKIAVCVISKSGNTTETLVNASVLLTELEKQFKKTIYSQTIFIGDPKTDFMKAGKRLKVKTITMPEIIGGRYSVASEVGLIPLALLGHDTDAFMSGIVDATSDEFESVVVEGAVRVHHYVKNNYIHYNFFAFDPRLAKLGAWYRQLFAESIGKEKDRSGKMINNGFLPTVSTPVELHSVGQLYLSGFSGVYTDFVTFDDDQTNYKVPKVGIAKKFKKFDMQEVSTAIYGGVISAYQERSLPYRSTIFDDNLTYSLGLFMGMRMLETMYIAELMNINAFNQPNVELYKTKTKEILGI